MPEGTGVGSVYLDFVVRNTVAQQIRDITSQAAAQAQMGFEAAGKASGDAMQRAFSGGYNKTLEKARVKVRELESQFDSLGSKMDGMRQSAKGMFKGLKDPGRAADQFRDALDAPAACRNTRRGGAAARQQQPCSTERSKGRRHRDEGARSRDHAGAADLFRARAFVGAGGVFEQRADRGAGRGIRHVRAGLHAAGRDAADGTGQRRLSAGRMGMGGRC